MSVTSTVTASYENDTSSNTFPSHKRSLKVLDLFAGAGGFSEGFIDAGCDMIAHVEMEKDACDTIRTRMIYHALKRQGRLKEYKKYLLDDKSLSEIISEFKLQKEYDSVIQAKIDRDNYKDLISEVFKRLNGDSLDIIIGGPPCQAYSHIGRASDPRHMKRDERKFLYIYYVEFLKALKPKLFVFENVPGLLSAGKGLYLRKMRRLMKDAGYTTEVKVFNTAKYGVPQERKRVILIGWNSESGITSYPSFDEVEHEYTVNDFLSDLPPLRAGEGQEKLRFSSPTKLLHKLKIASKEVDVLRGHTARQQMKQDLEIYKLAVKKKNKNQNIRYNELPERLKSHKNQTGFLDRFKVVDGSAKASHTIIAHISKDGHYYIHPDIEQNRSLSVREAARLQTFPDDFKFEGSRTSQYKQIGNAVPPMFSRIIALAIISALNSTSYEESQKTVHT